MPRKQAAVLPIGWSIAQEVLVWIDHKADMIDLKLVGLALSSLQAPKAIGSLSLVLPRNLSSWEYILLHLQKFGEFCKHFREFPTTSEFNFSSNYNRYYLLNTYNRPDPMLSLNQVLSHLILMTTLCVGYHYFCFIDEIKWRLGKVKLFT